MSKSVDKVILWARLSKPWESEGFDRPDIDVLGYTNQFIEEVAKANPNVIIVNQSGSSDSMPWIDHVPALVQAWYGGDELGNTISMYYLVTLTLPVSSRWHFPKGLKTILHSASTNGQVLYGEDVFVGYRYYEKVKTNALFPFCYGLSYSTFEFSDLKTNVERFRYGILEGPCDQDSCSQCFS